MKIIYSLLITSNYLISQIALPTFQGVHNPHSAAVLSGSQTFSYTGSQQTFTVPSGVSTITIKAWGAQGGSSATPDNGSYHIGFGGKGGYSAGEKSVTAGDAIYIYVGGVGETSTSCRNGQTADGGYNGGGNSTNYPGGGGGGSSDVRSGGTALSNRILIAAGAGGGAHGYNGITGGAGGGQDGQDGIQLGNFASRSPGQGASQSAGGGGSSGTGSLGQGGSSTMNHAGGGGGGYYGGGCGANSTGGGGGSGYIGGVSDGTTTSGSASMPDPDGGTMTGREGNGLIVISW